MINLNEETLRQRITGLLEDKDLWKNFIENPTVRSLISNKDIAFIENMFRVDIQEYNIKVGGPWFGACSL